MTEKTETLSLQVLSTLLMEEMHNREKAETSAKKHAEASAKEAEAHAMTKGRLSVEERARDAADQRARDAEQRCQASEERHVKMMSELRASFEAAVAAIGKSQGVIPKGWKVSVTRDGANLMRELQMTPGDSS